MDRIGVVDTMFACIDMGSIAERRLSELEGYGERFEVVRRTVPGFKDLAVAARRLIERDGCAIVVACGMPGGADLDEMCAHEASQGIMMAQVLTGTHILEVFVHMREESDPDKFATLCHNRVADHALNAYRMLYAPEELRKRAGQGIRQGGEDVGPLAVR
ncbi:riboflavin synthase [Streptantibioticus rubrisoli]|uniref:Riboflavin synthase n=1 Tax=Streptantibioticus rubrisoli TaxID=1387313 RepID=A0ABT1PAN9_9ACTN|nr:riboflavin synthase [Streptantibioticus rubrisoli]MCQ4041851.1 riboflavin synthase [Streptantibioticus rubrisoli]